MAYFNQNNDGAYKAYYKPKQAPGGTSSIFLGGDDKLPQNQKPNRNSSQKFKSRPSQKYSRMLHKVMLKKKIHDPAPETVRNQWKKMLPLVPS